MNAAVQLGRSKKLEPGAVEALLELLEHDSDTGVRVMVANALGATDDVRAINKLIELVKEESPASGPATAALRRIGEPAAGEIIKLLDDPNTGVRIFAVSLLRPIGGAKAMAALERSAQNDSDSTVRSRAKTAADQMRTRQTGRR